MECKFICFFKKRKNKKKFIYNNNKFKNKIKYKKILGFIIKEIVLEFE